MRTNTQAIAIAAPAGYVFEFVADLEKLPKWAIGFAKEIRRENGGWLVRTGSGDEIGIRSVTDPELGVVDYHMSPTPGMSRREKMSNARSPYAVCSTTIGISGLVRAPSLAGSTPS
jgi:hypothetical protein